MQLNSDIFSTLLPVIGVDTFIRAVSTNNEIPYKIPLGPVVVHMVKMVGC